MISVNLLPSEYRRPESTPIARFLAIVIGAVVVTGTLVAYGYVHYSQLSSAIEVRKSTEGQFNAAKLEADISRNLQAEHVAYEARRKAIQQVAGARILQSRKLDEFLSIMTGTGARENAQYRVWLDDVSVKPPRTVRKGKASDGGMVSFSGFSETQEFSRVTNLRDAIRSHAYFEDFQHISAPNFKAVDWDDGREPAEAGRFSFQLTLRPLGWRNAQKKSQ